MVFHATTPQVDFETKITWNEIHQHLKTAFPVALHAETARHEIQYGHAERPTHSNLPQDLARFEVSQQKWTDISEGGFGIAFLNDCKYGVNTINSEVRISLLKSGTHPDPRGDNGTHYMTYSFLPHQGSFSVEHVVRPAYELNIPVIPAPAGPDAVPCESLVSVDNPTVIIETVKWAEKGNAFIVRLYEAGKCSGPVTMNVSVPVDTVTETNLLEDPVKEIPCRNGKISFRIRPFEIKTFKLSI
jgi:alpha-mannosidase